jgi:hypothetical protein
MRSIKNIPKLISNLSTHICLTLFKYSLETNFYKKRTIKMKQSINKVISWV